MSEKAPVTFEVNDENKVNSYKFRVRNSALKWERFDANPVMLDSHINRTDMVRGNWQNRRQEGATIKMDANFDSEDPDSAKLEGKVRRGFVKGASLGLAIDFEEGSFERQPDGIWDLVAGAEVMEVTVCGVPSLSSALSLYDKRTGDKISEDQVKLSLQKLSANNVKFNTPQMEKIILTPGAASVALSLNMPSDGLTQAQVSEAITALHAQLSASQTKVTDLTDKNTELQGKIDLQAKENAKALADQAQLDGKITESEHAELMADAIENFTLTAKLVAKMPGKVSLGAQVVDPTKKDGEVKTLDDFAALSLDAQLSFKKDKPQQYAALFA